MGWNWRKVFNFGPLRVNLSKKGVGYSVGVRGFRVGRDAKGQDYSQTSVPGTGIYKRTYSGRRYGKQNLESDGPGRGPSCPSSDKAFA